MSLGTSTLTAGLHAARYALSAAFFDSDGVEADESAAVAWLQLASEAGFAEAQRVAANLVRRGTLPGSFDEAERLLKSAIRDVNQARLVLADLFMAQGGAKQLIAASYLVQQCFEIALGEKTEELADRCRARSPTYVAKLEAAGAGRPDEEYSLRLLTISFERLAVPGRREGVMKNRL